MSDPEIEEYEKKYINAELVDVDGQVGVKVSALISWQHATFHTFYSADI